MANKSTNKKIKETKQKKPGEFETRLFQMIEEFANFCSLVNVV